MSALPETSNTSAAQHPLLVQARIRWNALARRERLAVVAAAWAIGVAMLWMVGIQPAWRTLRETPAQRQKLDAQLDEMRRLAAEAQALRARPKLSPRQAEDALRAATARLGEGAKLDVRGDTVQVQLTEIPGPAFAAWLAEVRAGARMRPMQAQLMSVGKGYSGSIVLALPPAR